MKILLILAKNSWKKEIKLFPECALSHELELVSNIPWLTVVTRQIHAHYVAGHRGCTPHCPNQKLTKYGNLYLKWCKYTVPKWKINVLKRLLFQSISHWTRIILKDNSNVQVLLSLNKSMSSEQTVPDTIKPEQWPVQSQPTHCKCKGDKTGDTCAADFKQISIWLANKAWNK